MKPINLLTMHSELLELTMMATVRMMSLIPMTTMTALMILMMPILKIL